jgi:putative transposase
LKEDSILKVHAKSQKKLRHIKILNNIDIVRNNQGYFVHVLVTTSTILCQEHEKIGSIDLGIRTLGTVHIHNLSSNETSIVEYKHRDDLLKKYNNKLDTLKSQKGRVRKRHFLKIEKKKKDVVDLTHWLFINDLLSRTDIIYLGDIKSHDIVTGGKNKRLNRAFNDLKFYQLKTRLLYKAGLLGKLVDLTPEPYTTKTCSRCGAINNTVGSKEVFACPCCDLVTGRDFNAAKNMKMKGILS